MRRFTRRARRAATIAALVAAVGGLGLAASAVATPADELVVSGRFGADREVQLANRTVEFGRYLVAYSMLVYIAPTSTPVGLSCTVIDTSGRINFLGGMTTAIEPGAWARVSAEDTFELPSITLGLRCLADGEMLADIVFRDVQFAVTLAEPRD